MSTLKPNAPTPGPWTVGRERILELIDAGELERVAVNREHAQGLLLRARRHLKTARRLVVDDPEGAYTLLYDADAVGDICLLKGAEALRKADGAADALFQLS